VTATPSLKSRGFAQRAVSILSYAILLGGIITVVVALYLVVVTYSSLPYWDGWTQIFAAKDGNPLSLSSLWKQHNEHRMPIPKLFLMADLRWFHAGQVFLLASIFVIQFLQLLLLAWSMRVLGGWRGALWRTGVGLAAFCVFCPSQWENLTWGFQVCFVLPGLFATVSLIGLLLNWRSSQAPFANAPANGKYLALSIAAALGATWSLSNGNLLWPLLVAAALLLRLRMTAVLSYAIAGALSTVVYLLDYDHPTYIASSVKTPGATIKYLLAYFGSSWPGYHFRLAEFVGLAGLVAFLLMLERVPAYVRSRRTFDIQLVLIAAFCLATGVVTALGRSPLGTDQAFTSRYQTVSLLFWCCLGLVALGAVSLLGEARNRFFLAVQVGLLAIMLVAARHSENSLMQARRLGFSLNAAAMSLMTNVPDSEQLRLAFWNPDYLLTLLPYMRQERLSVFAEPDSLLLGKPLESAFALASSNECIGEVESTVPMPGAADSLAPLRITGWAWDYRQPPAQIVATTDGIITGLGAVGDWRPIDKATRPSMTSNYIGFTGYVERASAPVEIYAIKRSQPATACLIATVK
jgi:hypothetical protein